MNTPKGPGTASAGRFSRVHDAEAEFGKSAFQLVFVLIMIEASPFFGALSKSLGEPDGSGDTDEPEKTLDED